ncbi:MAG: tetratricopeptide repeat protein [Deltaproteobacteria bacterium]|nr:tetratricopeptide repeat protein [Deltaproteobacteria bacterium]
MKRGRLSFGLSLLAFAHGLVASPALAQPSGSGGPETEGERLFRLGRAAMLESRFDEACPMLAESQRLEPHVGTLLNLAACDERRGHYGSAWVEYQKALTAARAEGQSDRVQLAEARIAAIEPKVPWLRVSPPASGAEGLTIGLDGGELARAALGTEMPVDPGPHLVFATRDGKRVFEERIDIREGEHRTVSVSTPLPEPIGPKPDTVVVEPAGRSLKADPASKALGRWVIEPGLFMGWMSGTMDNPRITTSSGNVGPTLVRDPTTPNDTSTTSCASANCKEAALTNGSFVVGLSFFAGYAVSDAIVLGLRAFGAPSVAKGGFFGLGPSVVLRASDALSIGAFFTFGDASMSGKTTVTIPPGYRSIGGSGLVDAEGTLAGGAGIGLDISLKIAELQRGSLALMAMPWFTSGNGSAFALPFGLTYRFQ